MRLNQILKLKLIQNGSFYNYVSIQDHLPKISTILLPEESLAGVAANTPIMHVSNCQITTYMTMIHWLGKKVQIFFIKGYCYVLFLSENVQSK